MRERMRRLCAPLFFYSLALVHGFAVAGFMLGSWPMVIAADGLDLLALFDAGVGLALVLRSRPPTRRLGGALMAVACCCGALAWGPGILFSPDPRWDKASGAQKSGVAARVFKTKILQANVEAMGVKAQALEGLNFDVAMIAEWQPGDDQTWAHARGLSLVSFDPKHGDAALFSRWPATEEGCMADATGFCHAQWAVLNTPAGPLRVVAVHTRSPHKGWRARARDEFLEHLASTVQAWPETEPVVAAGDFNSTWATRSMRAFAAHGSWNGAERRNPTWPTFTARWGAGFRIDHVLATRGAQVMDQRTFDSGYSDHLWTLAEVELPWKGPGQDGAHAARKDETDLRH